MIHDLIVNAALLIAFISVLNQVLRNTGISPDSQPRIRCFFGLVMGFLGCILMLYRINITSSIIVDFRNIPIIFSGLYTGFVPAVITSLIIGLFRILYFGISVSSLTAFVAALITGLGIGFISNLNVSRYKKWSYCVVFALLGGSLAYCFLLSNKGVLITFLPVYWSSSVITAYFIFIYTEYITETNKMYRKLKEESTKDFLTGLNNVRQFDKSFNQVTQEVVERQESLAALFIDIDFFKKINDTYGHSEGDLILKQLAEILVESCRSFDQVFRTGGEEFVILLFNSNSENAVDIAERIRGNVETHNFELSDQRKIKLTVSLGIAVYPETTGDIDNLIKNADAAMYAAKQNGRNQTVLFKSF